ncbi:MAG: DUF1572 family protein [Saprospiraceae bacterium]|nr:DUF1572 family protein [Saprospiraceae bacterium]MCB9345871.1 DUF1572 family protein [Lewinellaceae bacterium]
MFLKTLIEFFERDLLKVKEELGMYKQESDIWLIPTGINNSGGNLVLHLVGNLKHFIGATLGSSGYERQRDLEFSSKDVPRQQMLEMLDETISVVTTSLERLSNADMEKNFPLEKHGSTVSNTHMLLHLLTHLNYHLGQLNYHRRLV